MRRRMLEVFSLVLGGLISGPAHAQDSDPRACEYGVPVPEVMPDPVAAPEYGIQEPVFLEPPPPPPLVVKGVVVRKVDGVPIPGVKVVTGDVEGLTGADGRFTLTLPGPGEPGADLEIAAEDIDGAEGGGRFKAGATAVTLTEDGLAPDEDVVLELARR